MLIHRKRTQRRPDPLFLLMVFVVVGMFATLSYQVARHSDAGQAKVARDATHRADAGG